MQASGGTPTKEARRHHFVPQFYLQQFADSGKISCANLQKKKVFLQAVRKAASVNDFHSLPGHPDGQDAFERTLSKIESSAAKVIAKASDKGIRSLSKEERSELAFFTALQYVRSPTQRRSMKHVRAQVVRLEIGFGGRQHVATWAREHLKLNDVSEAFAQKIWEDATSSGGPAINVSPAEHIDQMHEMIEDLWLYLIGRPTMQVRFKRKSLLTSDSPVGLIAREADLLDPIRGVGFRTAWGISFPLGRRDAIIYGDIEIMAKQTTIDRVARGDHDLELPASTALANLLNVSTLQNCSEWLYSHPEDTHLLPTPLPEPLSSAIQMVGGDFDFDRINDLRADD